MSILILFSAIVILSCLITNKFSDKLGMPSLVLFMFLGILFGSDGILKISFDNYDLTSQLCTIGLLFIIFYGGFCTKKPSNRIALQASLLSSVGTLLTAFFCIVFCYYGLKIPFAESFLIGAVISSTDAASVFSILRSKRLNLKFNTAPLLEIESGSNDPFAYILTLLGIVLIQGNSFNHMLPLLFKQIIFGIVLGVFIAYGAILIFKKTRLLTEGTSTLFLVSIVLFSYAIPDLLQGNGFLSAYIAGIILGNSEFKSKANLIHFFDGITALFQVLIFFLIGFLSFPHKIPEILVPAVLIMSFLTFIARPLAVTFLMKPFGAAWNQILFISAAGLRGAASIVFAIIAVANNSTVVYDLFHIVFVVVLLSVTLQGSFLPYLAKKLNMFDRFSDVRKTFNDYHNEAAISLSKVNINETHPWNNHKIKEIFVGENSLILSIIRNNKNIIPKGSTVITENDEILIGTTVKNTDFEINLCETVIDKNHEWLDKKISAIDCPTDFLIVLIKRGEKHFVPNGNTKILLDDTVIYQEN